MRHDTMFRNGWRRWAASAILILGTAFAIGCGGTSSISSSTAPPPPPPPSSSHSVVLNWTASASQAAAYNVYRSQTSGGPYSLVNSTPVTQTTFTDSKVQASQTYYYVTTAVDSQGVESAYSNQVTVSIPAN